jgi:hypothetical protein
VCNRSFKEQRRIDLLDLDRWWLKYYGMLPRDPGKKPHYLNTQLQRDHAARVAMRDEYLWERRTLKLTKFQEKARAALLMCGTRPSDFKAVGEWLASLHEFNREWSGSVDRGLDKQSRWIQMYRRWVEVQRKLYEIREDDRKQDKYRAEWVAELIKRAGEK